MVGADFPALDTKIKAGEAFDQQILVIISSDIEPIDFAETDVGIEAEVLLGVINELVGGNIDERNQPRLMNVERYDDMLRIASLHDPFHSGILRLQLEIDHAQDLIRLFLIQLFADELLNFVSNGFTELRFVVTQDDNAFDCVT